MFKKLKDVPEDQLDAVIDTFTERDWIHFEDGYLRIAISELEDWWVPDLGLDADIDVGLLFCKLYNRSITRTPGELS